MGGIRSLTGVAGLSAALILSASVGPAIPSWQRCLGAPQEIFVGITYGCHILATTPEGRGIFHWVRVDLGVGDRRGGTQGC